MLVNLLIRLCALSLGLSYVACTTPQQQSQLATLHERMNEMISALYSSPLLSKIKATTSSEEAPIITPSQESTYSYPAAPAPQVVYVSPPSFLEAGAQPTDYGYPTPTNPVPRAAWPNLYDYSYQPQFVPPAYSPSLSRPPYPEYARAAYPQLPAPQPPSIPPPFPSPVSYAPFSSAQYPAPFPVPACQPGYQVAPSLPNLYPQQVPYPPIPSSAPMSYPQSYLLSLPYPPSVPSPYLPPLPQQYAPSVPYPSPVPVPYPSQVPAPYPPLNPYPPSNSFPYSASLSYPQQIFQRLQSAPPVFPKPSDILPQPQYEYNS